MTAVKKSAAVAHPRRFACCFIFCLFFHSVVSLPVRFGFIFCSLGNSSAFSFEGAGAFLPLFGPAFLPLVHAAVCVATSGSLRRLFSKRRIYSPFRRFPARENHPAGLRSRIHRKAPGYSLSRSHIHPAKVPFCATRRLSFAAETVLFPVLLGLCLSNSEIFLAANPFPLRREFFLLFCQNSARPMSKDSSVALRFFLRQQDLLLVRTAMVVPARRGGKFPDPPFFLVPAELASYPYCHGRACPARGKVP